MDDPAARMNRASRPIPQGIFLCFRIVFSRGILLKKRLS